MSILGELIINGIGAFLDVIGYHVAKRVLPAISFGRVRVELLDEEITCGQKWNEIRRDKNGVIVIDADVAAFLMLIVFIVMILVCIVVYEHISPNAL